MKHKADIGNCKVAKHKKEIELNAEPHRDGVRFMSLNRAAKANLEVETLLALGLTQISFSPWASGIVMVKENSAFVATFAPN